MTNAPTDRGRIAVPGCIAILLSLLTSCGTVVESPSAALDTFVAPTPAPITSPPQTAVPIPSPEPTGSNAGGFAFEAPDVIAYYQSIGYVCAEPRPSTQAAGYAVVICELIDEAGRSLTVGFVTDSAGRLGNGYAAVQAATGETYLSPQDALDPLAAFLGTMLGGERGAEAAIWMKAHLGESYATTTLGPVTVATYTGNGDDPSQLFVEVADEAYLRALPAPTR